MLLAEGGLQASRIDWERRNRSEDLTHRQIERRRHALDDTRRQGRALIVHPSPLKLRQ